MNFQQDVIERSFALPVVVDFWAPWCGPCRVLGPVLETLAAEQSDRWALVKINTEEEEELALRYHIMSIPSVKLFYRGEVLDAFQGALPRAAIEDWLKRAMPSPGQRALDAWLETQDGQPDPEPLARLMDQYPDEPAIRLVMAEVLLWDDPARALLTLEPIRLGHPLHDRARFIRDIAEFLQAEGGGESVEVVRQRMREAHVEGAIQAAIETLGHDVRADDGRLAKAAIGIFAILGHQHPYAKTYRKKLDMVLWA